MNWDSAWQHRPLLRQTGDRPRQPIVCQPDNLSGTRYDTPEGRQLSERYWSESFPQDWPTVSQMLSDGFDVALMPATSGLVVLDCDVKQYDDDTGFVVVGNTATLAPPVVKYGLDDLVREVEQLGHSAAELATYAVQTKSGGVHLYYREHPEIRIQTTRHRDQWRVDVVAHNGAGDRSWVAAPPTAGYAVIRDLPVAPLPDWLAEWLAAGLYALPRLGGARQRRLVQRVAAARDAARQVGATESSEPLTNYLSWELHRVTLANQVGGWNLAIFETAANLFDAGWDRASVAEAIRPVAKPLDEREWRKADDTINSAWRNHLRKTNRARSAS